ncbi:DNA helicase, partial [Vibrio parahaemolyticus]|nr:DNA helicase [Vibrio parahaemolyticus]
MGVIQTALGYTGAGHKVFWAGGIESYQIDYLEDIFWFSREERERVRNKQILNDYEDYQEFTEIARATQDNEMFRAMAIIEAYEDLPEHLAILRLNTVKDELVENVS